MKTNPFLLLVMALIIVFLTVSVYSADQAKTFDVGAGGSLVVVVVGDVALRTSSGTQVTVQASGIPERELSRLSMSQTGNTVRVEYRPREGRAVDAGFSINLPTHFDVDVKTSGGDITLEGNLTGTMTGKTAGGDIRIGDIDGRTDLSTAGGDIVAGKVGGDASLKTAGGDIRLAWSDGQVEATTAGGDIAVGDVGRSLKATTAGGDVRIENVNGDATVSTSGGDVRVGKVSGSAKLNTSGGDIECQGATGQVSANTAGGDIRLQAISGALTANTAGGDITAELTPGGGGSSLNTAGGELTIFLPEDARARIEAVIEIRGRWATSHQDYQISSDFRAVDQVIDDQAREIRAVYDLNGGGELIRMKTTNGNIRIRKAAR
jgi:hypothetical protein